MSSPGNAYEIHALSGAYAVDALDPDEKAQFEEHLASCAACQAEVASLQETTALLAETAEADPPPALRDRLLDEIKTVRPLPPRTSKVAALRPRRRRTLLAAAAAVLALAGGGTVVWQQVSGPDQGQLSVADQVLRADDAERVGVELPGGVTATLTRSVSVGRAVLVTRNMPEAPEGRVYEVWLQTPEDDMVPAGLMKEAGDRTLVLEGDAAAAIGAGITVEPEGGSEEPTTEPIVLFDFEQAT